MLDIEPSFPLVLAYAAPLFALSVGLEWYFVSRKALKGRYEGKDAVASMTMGLGNLVTDLGFGFISLGFLMWLWQFRVWDWGYGVLAIMVALVLQDFLYYWKHRFAHQIRWLWSAHIVHHSSEHYNLSTALRQPWNNHFTGYILLSTPLILLGFHPLLIAFVASLNLLYQFWIHTEAIDKMPKAFEAVFNTPSHHRAHHGTNPRYLDCNFAGIFIVWDKLFKTYVAEQAEDPVTYGVVTPIRTYNPFKIAFGEWICLFKDCAAPGLTVSERFKYGFAPPGYSHDGSRKGSIALKQDYVSAHPEQSGTPGLPRLSQTTKQRPLL